MLDIFVKEDKYLNAKHIQQQMDKDYPEYHLILYTEIFIYLKI